MKPWPTVKLGDVLRRVERFEPRDELTEYPFAGTYSFARGIFVSGRKLGSTFALPKIQRIHAGDFIYCKIMAWEGAFGIAPKETDNRVMSGAFVVYELNRELIDEKFLDYFFKVPDHWQSIGSQSTGTNVRRQSLHPSQFEKAEIPLPPLVEQRRVMARIEALAAQFHEARALRHQAAEEAEVVSYAQARLMLSQVNEQPTPLANWLNPKREGIQTGPFGAQLSKSEFTDSGVPLLTIGNVQYGGLDSCRLTYVSPNKAEQLSRYKVGEGDILFARMGTVGRCCVVPKQADGWLINYHIIRVALDISRVEPRFIHWTIQASTDIENYLGDKTRGATRAGVNSKIVSALPCRVPPLAEQRRIVAELDALQAEVDALKRLQAETAAELDALLPSILDRAFKGEL